MSSRLRSVLVLCGFLLAAFSAAALAGIATSVGVREWYPTLVKPSWNPPAWLFGPVWSVLYTCMAIAAWRVWRLPVATTPERRSILTAWWVQLGLNAGWSFAFFYARRPELGALVIVTLFVLLAWIQPRLARNDRPAALFWTPYVLWVGFATVLNLTLWHLN